jgi:beta-lactamase regulating signal transducer with metallopeptidase domain
VLHFLIPLTGDLGPALRLAASLLSTYVVHGLVWAAAVALLTHRGRMAASTNAWMWRLALFGPLLTTVVSATLSPALDQQYSTPSLIPVTGVVETNLPGQSSAVSTFQQGESTGAYWLGESLWRWLGFALSAALLLGLARFARAAWLVSRRVRGSRPSADERSKRLLEGLMSQTRMTRVRLTESLATTNPFSVGLGEICLPKRLLDGMSDSELEAVLAHELAHLERRDGLWFPAVAFVEAVLWIYPLTHWVSSRARYCSELACDDRAVALTKKPRALALALAHVAENARDSHRCALHPSMADSSGLLLTRVKRLVGVDAGSASKASTTSSRWAVVCAAATGCSLSAVSLDLPEGQRHLPVEHASVAAPGTSESSRDPASEMSAIERELAALSISEREVQAELDAMVSDTELSSSDTPPPRRLELEQELRHSSGMRALLEAELRELTAVSARASR